MSESPRRLRARQTFSKFSDGPNDYRECVLTPIGKNRRSDDNVGLEALTGGRVTRKSSRHLQLNEKNSPTAEVSGHGKNGKSDDNAEAEALTGGRMTRKSSRHVPLNGKNSLIAGFSGQDGSESTCSFSTTNSNAENSAALAREINENTPRSKSKLSRNRSERRGSYVAHSSFNDANGSVKCTIRRQPPAPISTPKGRELPVRNAKLRSSIVLDITLTDDDDDSDDQSPQKSTTRRRNRNASYFTKEDMAAYVPEGESEDEEVLQTSSEDEDGEEDNSSEGSNDSDDEDHATPTKRLLLTQDLTKLTLTPEILNRLEGRSVRRHIGVNSPVATGSQTMSPNPETYFLADTRIKYKSSAKGPAVMNDAMKGKRRKKKLVMGPEERLPEKIPTDFSVTAEAIKATVNPEHFISGNIHEDKVEQLFKNVIENEFPHWIGLFRDGFNVMLYGYGSKLSIFREFEEFVNSQYLAVTINGLFPKLVPRKLLYGIYEHVNPEGQIPRGVNLEAVAKDVINSLKTVDHSDVFILVNNFDNMALRFPQMLTVLCWLSQVPYIHILASCDSVNSFLGVTQSQALQLNFCWMHCPTYISYREELKWIPGIYGDETKIVTQKSSLNYVLQSLTGNARKAFAILAQMQLKQMKSRAVRKAKEAYTGVRFQELAKECREKFIAHSDENLRTLLVEFFDHKLIKQTGKGKHLENTLLVELDLETLEEIISELS